MTTTTTARLSARQEPSERSPGEKLPPPPKLRRRPGLIAASVAAVCLGALVSVWAYTSSTETQSVLAVRETVHRGEVITAEDLMTVNVTLDPALRAMPAAAASEVVGQRAAVDLPAGGVVPEGAVTAAVVPAEGRSIVGVSLMPAMMPAGELVVGDTVRVVTTPGPQGEIAQEAPDALSGVVLGLTPSADGTGATVVNLDVDADDAALLASHAATGKVALVLDSREH